MKLGHGHQSYRRGQASLIAANCVYELMTRRWFDFGSPQLDRSIYALLMHIYIRDLEDRPISKKEAWEFIGVRNKRTGRKYLSLAQKRGFLEMSKSDDEDGRKHFLVPSDSFRLAVRREFQLLARKFRDAPFSPFIPIPDDDVDPVDLLD
jgi:hypothetical protein